MKILRSIAQVVATALLILVLLIFTLLLALPDVVIIQKPSLEWHEVNKDIWC